MRAVVDAETPAVVVRFPSVRLGIVQGHADDVRQRGKLVDQGGDGRGKV